MNEGSNLLQPVYDRFPSKRSSSFIASIVHVQNILLLKPKDVWDTSFDRTAAEPVTAGSAQSTICLNRKRAYDELCYSECTQTWAIHQISVQSHGPNSQQTGLLPSPFSEDYARDIASCYGTVQHNPAH